MAQKFVVELGNVEIGDKAAAQLQDEIQQAALRAVARLDLHGDVIVRFPPGTMGIIIDDRRNPDILRELSGKAP